MQHGGTGRGRTGLSLLLLLLAPRPAAASPGATLSLKPLLWSGDARNPTLLLATACSDDTLEDAILELDYGTRRGLQIQQERIDVPAGACVRRALTTTVRSELRATLRAKGGRAVARARPEQVGWWRSGVVLDASLKGIVNGSSRATFTMIPPDVEVPPDAMAWSSVSYVVTRNRSLSDQPPNLRRAIEQWVLRGGTLVVASGQAHPAEVRGAGRVVTLPADETLPRRLEDFGFPRPSDDQLLTLEPGVVTDTRHFYWQADAARRDLESIDPNVGHPPSTGLSWVLLLGYVALVGPLSYRWLARKGRTLLAIGTVPASAALLMTALASHGVLEKGMTPRYSAVVAAEVLVGERSVAVRRTAGLVTTRPGWMRIESSRAASLNVLSVEDRAPRWRRTVVGGHSEGRRTVLETGPVGLWDTVFVAESVFVDLGGTVDIIPAGSGFRIVNRTARTIRSAVLRQLAPPRYEPRQWSLGSLGPGSVRQVDAGESSRADGPPALPPLMRGTRGYEASLGVRLVGTLDEPLLPPFRGYVADRETTWLQVVMP
jgi:hypothetical protein